MGRNPLSQMRPWLCPECGTAVSDDEYVVNWGSCNECFDRSYHEYLRTAPPEEESEYDSDLGF